MKTLLTDIHKNCCSENKRDGLHSSLSFLLLTSTLLHFRGTRFGHLHGVLAVGVKHRLLQRPWSALGVGGGVARSPGAELVLAVALRRRQAGGVFVLEAKTLCVCVCERLTDVLLPVTRDLAVDLVGAIFARRLPQTFATVSTFRDALPVAGLSGGALRAGLGFIIFTTCWSTKWPISVFVLCTLHIRNLRLFLFFSFFCVFLKVKYFRL